MNCPTCKHTEHRVLRSVAKADAIRRVRQCDRCGQRWATLELLEAAIAEDREKLARARELAAALE